MDRYDAAAAIGTVILTIGVWMIHPAAALIVLGAAIIIGSLLIAPAEQSGHAPDSE